MKVLKSLNSLYVEGSDSYTFIDSLVSNSINENEYKFSYLLGSRWKSKLLVYIFKTKRFIKNLSI